MLAYDLNHRMSDTSSEANVRRNWRRSRVGKPVKYLGAVSGWRNCPALKDFEDKLRVMRAEDGHSVFIRNGFAISLREADCEDDVFVRCLSAGLTRTTDIKRCYHHALHLGRAN